ncbi:hypothetical protein ACWGNA_21980 [Brucella cytisi]|uniref:hypothetical protein n=1 Tax=Brucella cytisi TaxID=407152 RepID=UPI0035DD1A95
MAATVLGDKLSKAQADLVYIGDIIYDGPNSFDGGVVSGWRPLGKVISAMFELCPDVLRSNRSLSPYRALTRYTLPRVLRFVRSIPLVPSHHSFVTPPTFVPLGQFG